MKGWICTKGNRVLHFSEADGWTLNVVIGADEAEKAPSGAQLCPDCHGHPGHYCTRCGGKSTGKADLPQAGAQSAPVDKGVPREPTYEDLRNLLMEVQIEMRHALTFICSREKMHPTGVLQYEELRAAIEKALDAAPDRKEPPAEGERSKRGMSYPWGEPDDSGEATIFDGSTPTESQGEPRVEFVEMSDDSGEATPPEQAPTLSDEECFQLALNIRAWRDDPANWNGLRADALRAADELFRRAGAEAMKRRADVPRESMVLMDPITHADLLEAADEIVRSKSVWKRFIDGTPLSNDIAVWMVQFAREWATTIVSTDHVTVNYAAPRADEAEKDAARYRWLRQRAMPWDSKWLDCISGDAFDAAIDAAMKDSDR